jgi:hypothetical protein
MLTRSKVVHLGGPYCIDAQLVVSIHQNGDPAMQRLGFHHVLLAESKHKRRPSKNPVIPNRAQAR